MVNKLTCITFILKFRIVLITESEKTNVYVKVFKIERLMTQIVFIATWSYSNINKYFTKPVTSLPALYESTFLAKLPSFNTDIMAAYFRSLDILFVFLLTTMRLYHLIISIIYYQTKFCSSMIWSAYVLLCSGKHNLTNLTPFTQHNTETNFILYVSHCIFYKLKLYLNTAFEIKYLKDDFLRRPKWKTFCWRPFIETHFLK